MATLAADPEQQNVRKMFGQEQRDCFKTEHATIPLREIIRLPNVAFMLAIYFLVFLGFNFYYIAFPVHAAGALGWTLKDTGLYFSFLSVVMVFVQGPLLGWASKRASDASLVISGSLILSVSFLGMLSTQTVPVYAAAALIAIGNGLMWPSVLSILSRVADGL